MSRPLQFRVWLHTVAGCLMALVALYLGEGALAGVPLSATGRLAEWWSASGPIVGAFSVLRIAVLLGAAYWTGLGLTAIVLHRSGSAPEVRVAFTRLLPGFGWVARGLLSGSITGVAVLAGAGQAGAAPGGTPPTSTPVPTRPAVEAGPPLWEPVPPGLVPPRLVPLGPPARHTGAPAGTSPAPSTTPPIASPPSTVSPPPSVAAAPSRPTPPTTGAPPSSVQAAPLQGAGLPRDTTWTVRAGDNLWSISESVLGELLGRHPSEAETARYWSRLIEVNRPRLPDPGNPDLIFAGESLTLPPL